jgi:hypothetical protein
MQKFYWLLALPLILAASIDSAHASSIRDNAGLFDPDVVRQAEAALNRIERDSKITTTIETIDSLQGEPIRDVTVRHAERSGTEGIYILIPKQEHKFEILVSRPFLRALTRARRDAIREAFINGFERRDFDGGLRQGVQMIEREVAQAKAENGGVLRQVGPAPGVPVRGRPAHQGSFGLGSLLLIGLLILAVLFGIRLLGSLFGGGYRAGYPGPGPRPMGGPGYGGPGSGGGGGFWSSMFGGIGGALAGNWLYDQFSGRHHGGYVDNTTSGPSDEGGQIAESGGNDWSGGGDSGGDWGGGDSGGGGGWGGGGDGGGDWGGGGDGGAGGDW